MDLTVVIASFGDTRWLDLAQERAVPSLNDWDDTFVYHLGDTYDISVGQVRNMAVRASRAEGWLLFLDPDDQLAPGYIDIMLEATKRGSWTDLYVPALQLIRNGRPYEPQVLDDRDIINGLNPCPIGTLIHRDMFDRVGGFWDERAWEDWSLFRRAVLAGAELRFVASAVYQAHETGQGRNSTVTDPQQLRREIIESHADWARRMEDT